MKPWIVVFVLLGGMRAAAQPVIDAGGIVNAASYAPAGLPNSGIAQGSMFVVTGKNLGPQWVQSASSLPLPTSLAGVSLSFAVGSKTVQALLIYASAARIGAIIPSGAPIGVGVLKVSYKGVTSSPASLQVVRNAPGIMTLNGAGYGPAAVLSYNSPFDQPLNTAIEAAHPAQIAILWATGLGPITGGDSGPPPVGTLPFNIQVIAGGKAAKIQYAGRSPEFPGIDQVNFEIPAGIAGCQVPIALKVEGAMSNYGTISVASSGKACSDWQGLPGPEIAALPEAEVGSILLGQTSMVLNTPAGANSSLGEDLSGTFFRRTGYPALYGVGPRDGGVMLGSCLVHSMKAQDSVQWSPYNIPGVFQGLDAGEALSVIGPNGVAQVARGATGAYSGALTGSGGAPFVQPGAYSINNGAGGADIGAFHADLIIPPAITWTNAGGIKEIARTQPLEILWTGGDGSREFVVIVGSAMAVANQTVASFICAERVDSGKFTVPADVLASLPPASAWTSGGYPAGMLSVGTMPALSAVRFSAWGLAAGYFSYSRQQLINVTYK